MQSNTTSPSLIHQQPTYWLVITVGGKIELCHVSVLYHSIAKGLYTFYCTCHEVPKYLI